MAKPLVGIGSVVLMGWNSMLEGGGQCVLDASAGVDAAGLAKDAQPSGCAAGAIRRVGTSLRSGVARSVVGLSGLRNRGSGVKGWDWTSEGGRWRAWSLSTPVYAKCVRPRAA